MGDSEEKNTYDNLLKQYEFDGQSYVYKDPKTNVTYKFDQEKNEWVVKETEETKADSSGTNEVKAREGTFGFENDTHTYTDRSQRWQRLLLGQGEECLVPKGIVYF